MKNTRWREFETAQSMQKSQNLTIYQGYIIWSCEKAMQKKKKHVKTSLDGTIFLEAAQQILPKEP